VKYAVGELGYVSQIAVLPAFAHATESSELVAPVSRDAEKLKKIVEKIQSLEDLQLRAIRRLSSLVNS